MHLMNQFYLKHFFFHPGAIGDTGRPGIPGMFRYNNYIIIYYNTHIHEIGIYRIIILTNLFKM